MASIRHIAIFSDNPHELAEFYRDVFGLTITRKTEGGSAWLSDGYMDIALLSTKVSERPQGIHHWGFTVDEDEKAEIYAKLEARSLDPFDPRRDGLNVPRPFVEDAAHDIDGNRYDISTGMRADKETIVDTTEKAKKPKKALEPQDA